MPPLVLQSESQTRENSFPEEESENQAQHEEEEAN